MLFPCMCLQKCPGIRISLSVFKRSFILGYVSGYIVKESLILKEVVKEVGVTSSSFPFPLYSVRVFLRLFIGPLRGDSTDESESATEVSPLVRQNLVTLFFPLFTLKTEGSQFPKTSSTFERA